MNRNRATNNFSAVLALPSITLYSGSASCQPTTPSVCDGAAHVSRVIGAALKRPAALVRAEAVSTFALTGKLPGLLLKSASAIGARQFNSGHPLVRLVPRDLFGSKSICGTLACAKGVSQKVIVRLRGWVICPKPMTATAFPRAELSRVFPVVPNSKRRAALQTLLLNHVIRIPYCAGSGTTGAAALNTGRRAILIEREAEYVDIARARIAAAQAPLLNASDD